MSTTFNMSLRLSASLVTAMFLATTSGWAEGVPPIPKTDRAALESAESKAVFLVGSVDGSAAEFAPGPHPHGWCNVCGGNCSGLKGAPPRHKWFQENKGAQFRMGTSRAADIPRELYPCMTEGVRVEFRLNAPRPLTLHVGLADVHWAGYAQWTKEDPRIAVSVNGGATVEQSLKGTLHQTRAFSIPLEGSRFVAGENHLTLRLLPENGSSVLLFDYLLLGDSAEPPPNPAVRSLLANALGGSLAGVEEVVFTTRREQSDGHYYASFGRTFAKGYGSERSAIWGTGGRLMKLNLRTGKTTVLIEDLEGSVRDPQVHYNGQRILFSWLKGGTDCFNLYEINVDGSGLKRITDGPYDDIQPTYLPGGGIVFSSSRANRSVNCWIVNVATLYRCDAEGRNIRALSPNLESDNTPWLLPDGRVVFTRWEYNDRAEFHFKHLWACNPDGSNTQTYFGNMHGGHVFIGAKPIPGSDDMVFSLLTGHGLAKYSGCIYTVSPKNGPDDLTALKPVGLSLAQAYRDPWPLSGGLFLATVYHPDHPSKIVLMARDGPIVPLFELPAELRGAEGGAIQIHEVRPIQPRPREQTVPDRIVPGETTGRLLLANVYTGRRMDGVNPGEIKKLLVLEALPKPVGFKGWMQPMSHGQIYTLVRVLGDVPVEPDGSAYFEAPADRMLFFVALDEQNLSVKRMQSIVSLVPGEVTSCVGCHDQRTLASPLSAGQSALKAASRQPSTIAPIAGVPERGILDFPRDVQPILDRHCATCHNPDRPEANIVLSGDHTPTYSHSYVTLLFKDLAGTRAGGGGNRPPRSVGSSASGLMKKIDGRHKGVQLTAKERNVVRCWIECGGAYPGTYAALGTGSVPEWYGVDVGGSVNQLRSNDREWPEVIAAMDAMKRRCMECHNAQTKRALPMSISDDLGVEGHPGGGPSTHFPIVRFGRHWNYNLTRPEKARLLMVPLARSAGGYAGDPGRPPKLDHPVVFQNTEDPDYRALLAAMRRYKAELDGYKRFDMPGFQPNEYYLFHMARYGVLPPKEQLTGPVNPYEVDEAYFRTFWPKEGAR